MAGADAKPGQSCDAARFSRNQRCDDPADENFVLRPSLQSNMMTGLAMEKKFQLNQTGQMLEHARFRQEELRQLSHPILAAPEISA
jgi:hypothetical protein